MTENPDAAEGAGGDGQRQERTVRLTVPEMDCPSCAQKVDKSLQRVDGVVDAYPPTDYGNGRCHVRP